MDGRAKKPPAHEVILDRLKHYVEQPIGADFDLRSAAVQELCLVLTQMEIPAPARQKVADDLRLLWTDLVRQTGFHGDGNPFDLFLSDAVQTLITAASTND